MNDGNQAILALLVLNLAVYLLIPLQIFRRRGRLGPDASSLEDSFTSLLVPLRGAIPDLSPGFTWREALRRARTLGLEVNWSSVDAALDGYERRRYGLDVKAQADFSEVLKLRRLLLGAQKK